MEVLGPRNLPFTGTFRTREEICRWFASIPTVDDIQAFEPREFIPGGEHVTVLGWERTAARPSGKVFESEWVHVFTVRDGRASPASGACTTTRRRQRRA